MTMRYLRFLQHFETFNCTKNNHDGKIIYSEHDIRLSQNLYSICNLWIYIIFRAPSHFFSFSRCIVAPWKKLASFWRKLVQFASYENSTWPGIYRLIVTDSNARLTCERARVSNYMVGNVNGRLKIIHMDLLLRVFKSAC